MVDSSATNPLLGNLFSSGSGIRRSFGPARSIWVKYVSNWLRILTSPRRIRTAVCAGSPVTTFLISVCGFNPAVAVADISVLMHAWFWVALRRTSQICAALLPRNEYAIFHPNSLERSDESALRHLGLPRISNRVRQRKVLDQVHPKPNVERTACKMPLQNPATSRRRDIR